ncbi:DUF397 domain-containing protein [Actinokineospora sp.]|uniref:DUF397 domain-containing protein n=1 Tax=Actinokineospora sp. TaxID=1872133 RepID=UPI0040383F01
MALQYTWRKSGRSANNANCVELRNTLDHLRDSKNTTGPTLRGNIQALTHAIQTGQFDRLNTEQHSGT